MTEKEYNELKEAFECFEFGTCNAQVIFNKWNEIFGHSDWRTGSYCSSCVSRLKTDITKKLKDYADTRSIKQ